MQKAPRPRVELFFRPRKAQTKVMAEPRNDNWFVQFQGHCLGPITTDQLLSSLRQHELGPNDKVAKNKSQSWKQLREYPEFADHLTAFYSKRPKFHEPPPPVETLLKKRSPRQTSSPKKKNPKLEAASAIPEVKKVKQDRGEAKPILEKNLPERPEIALPKNAMPQFEQLALLEIFRDWKKKSSNESNKTDFIQASANNKNPELKLSIDLRADRKTIWIVVFLLVSISFGITFYSKKKTGDQENLRSPNPPSPTMQPSSQGDPIPVLKAPTRPQRD